MLLSLTEHSVRSGFTELVKLWSFLCIVPGVVADDRFPQGLLDVALVRQQLKREEKDVCLFWRC